MTLEMYAIPNCNTVKKARVWLNEHGFDYTFHDYKKEGITAEQLNHWCEQVGWELLLNKRGTTWRKLSDDAKQDINQGKAVALMVQYPSMIKRPVLLHGETILVGFSEADYATLSA